jgi:hypothetical protein
MAKPQEAHTNFKPQSLAGRNHHYGGLCDKPKAATHQSVRHGCQTAQGTCTSCPCTAVKTRGKLFPPGAHNSRQMALSHMGSMLQERHTCRSTATSCVPITSQTQTVTTHAHTAGVAETFQRKAPMYPGLRSWPLPQTQNCKMCVPHGCTPDSPTHSKQ